MPDNPFAAPESRPPALGVRSGRQADVLAVARYQKGILWCILAYVLCAGAIGFVTVFLLPAGPLSQWNPAEIVVIVARLLLLVAAIAGVVFTFLLAIKVFHPVVGALFGLLALVPCAGLIVLLLVSARANKILVANGFRVGLMGANLQEVRAAIEREESVADESPRVD